MGSHNHGLTTLNIVYLVVFARRLSLLIGSRVGNLMSDFSGGMEGTRVSSESMEDGAL
jgi:hypothetical protein